LDPAAFAALEYAIPEPLPTLRAAQQETLRPFVETIRFPADLAELAAEPLPGIAFGNELLDALPFHLVERLDGRWLECRVHHPSGSGFAWKTAEIEDPSLLAALQPIRGDFPDGYRTEVRTCFHSFLEPLARCLESPLMIWPDYGFARPDYYHPARSQGTLRTYRNHQAGSDPLGFPGESDITAHVDFTAVAEATRQCGGEAVEFTNQGAWLTQLAREWLLSLDGRPDPKALRQFQTLTHPAQLGGSFQVLELSWKPGAAPADPELLARRLCLNRPDGTEKSTI
jgi:SAM-dependent MidA family methyltransferase